MRLIDTHTHLDFEAFDADRPAVIARSLAQGVERMLILGVDRDHWTRLWQTALAYPSIFAAPGLHPAYVERHRDEDLQALSKWLDNLAGHPKLCAIGEIGLDFYIGHPNPERQYWFFKQQLTIANEFCLPILLHVRRAHAHIIATLKRQKVPRTGIVHAFSGSWEEAKEYLRLGFLLGLGGAGTWPQAQRMQRVLRQLPLESIVLETDAPDLSPVGHAGERNSPEYLPQICQTLAQLKGISAQELAQHSYRNSCALFGWPVG